ncbi:MAG: hypothetical protein NVS9B2_17140 [Steroidobacteraceae bacterium]
MRNAPGEAASEILEDRCKIAVRIALMKEHGFARRNGHFQLGDEGRALSTGWREIAAVVQAAFADRDHFGAQQQGAQLGTPRSIEALRMMGVHAGGARKLPRLGGREPCSLQRACQIRPGHYLAAHTRLERACHDGVTILRKALMGEVRANIDQ